MEHIEGPGTYVLVIKVAQDTRLTAGSLGVLACRAGYYLYVGSALGGLHARLARHLRSEKRLHWHIDYLLQVGQVSAVWFARGTVRRECDWAHALASAPSVHLAVARFGASDCACPTHLFYCAAHPSLADVPGLAHDNLETRDLTQAPGPVQG